jgi:hypothetical protein
MAPQAKSNKDTATHRECNTYQQGALQLECQRRILDVAAAAQVQQLFAPHSFVVAGGDGVRTTSILVAMRHWVPNPHQHEHLQWAVNGTDTGPCKQSHTNIIKR